MKETEIIINDDYAVLTSANYYFYYGYEFDRKELENGDEEEIWGFEVSKDNKKVFRISADEMEKYKNCPNRWQCEKMLLLGIGMYLSNVEDNEVEE